MKRIITVCTAILMTVNVFLPQQAGAQAPEKMSYQAVVRDGSNNLVTSTAVGMQISVLQGSASGTAVYVETQTPTTNANGLISIEIGLGTVESGDFTSIDWANGPHFIKTETDPAGGTNYSITGTSQLLSVPYALHAKTAESVIGEISETDPTFTDSEAANITESDITNLDNLSGVNTGDQDISGIATNRQAIQDTALQIRADMPDTNSFLTAETDPTFTGSEAANVTENDVTNLGNLSGVNTGDQDISGIATNRQAIQDTASQIRADIPDVSGFLTAESDPSVPQGIQSGEMQYWNGAKWLTVPAGSNGQTLTFINGVPVWVGSPITEDVVANPTTGKIWMDRNLGASQAAISSTDVNAYGDLYQWGRGTDGHQIRTSAITTTLSGTDEPGNGDFITTNSSPYDWRSPQNDNLWQGVSDSNNPCPNGYRLPSEAEWEAERLSWNINNDDGAFHSPLKLPMGGYRSRSNGSLIDVGVSGHYWSSTISGTVSRFLLFYSDLAHISNYHRANGSSVRCIKD